MSPPVLILKDQIPSELDAGVEFPLLLSITAPSGLNLRGAPFEIKDSDRTVLAGELSELTGDQHDTAEITLRAPEQVGEFAWAFVLPAREIDGDRYEESSLSFSFKTRAHATSLAVWGEPSPIVAGNGFSVYLGAKCSVGCLLAGKDVDVLNEAGEKVGTGSLGDAVWPGTTALYWTSVALTAPAEHGRFSWAVRFSSAELHLPHANAAASLGFVTVPQPEHTMTVRVMEKDSDTPVANAQVRLGAHRASTDEAGVATVAVPGGEQPLSIWKAGYDAPDRTVPVTRSEELVIEMTKLPEEDPFAFWRG